jgi:uncharacterized protein (DUF983 family)
MAKSIVGGISTDCKITKLWNSNLRKANHIAAKLAESNPALIPHVEDIATEAAVKCTNARSGRVTRAVVDAARSCVKCKHVNGRKPFQPLGNGPVELASPTAIIECQELIDFVSTNLPTGQMKLWWELVAAKHLTLADAAECCRVSTRTSERYMERVRAILEIYIATQA